MELIVKGMTSACEATVKRALQRLAPQAEARIEQLQGRALITGNVDVECVLGTIGAEGCKVFSGA